MAQIAQIVDGKIGQFSANKVGRPKMHKRERKKSNLAMRMRQIN